MSSEAIWQAFRETGEPVCYLLYKAAKDKQRPEKRSPAGD